ncbi:MAG: TonB-dependent receptor [Geothrix sp.]|nr:TonB-dependent receptor [Geothrix sp.]
MNRRFTTLTLTALACATVASAQTSSTAGAVRGAIKNKAGQAVVNATLSLRNRETGLSRTATSGVQGEYHIGLLPVGNYELTVTASGMRTLKDANVQVSLGQNTIANFSLDTAEASAMVEIVASSTALDTTQVNSVTSVDSKLVEVLPLSAGRDFTALVQLTPGAVYDADNNRVSVEGARGIQNNLTIDGASYQSNFFGEQRGSTRIPFAFGADTIKELQIITNAFDAQYGNAAGAVINAVSKTGTNEFSGTSLFQIRPKSLVARITPVPYDRFGTINTDQALTKNFTQTQFNVNVGGPIIKDKLHYFIGVETYKYKEDFTPNFAISAIGGNSLASFTPFMATFGGLVVGNDGRTLAQEGGRTYTNDRTNTVYFGRLDWSINENHRATLRVNAQDWKAENGTTGLTSTFAPTTGQTQQGLEKNSGLSWVAELNSVFGANLVNEARIQRAIERRPRFANSTAAPEFVIGSGFSAGQNNFLPNGLDEHTWQIIDNLTWTQGDWTVKGGVDLQFFEFANTFYRYQNGSFFFGSYDVANRWALGTAAPADLNGLRTTDSLTYTGAYSAFGGTIAYKSKLLAGYVQGQYQGLLDRRLLLSLGLRATREDQPENPRPNPLLGGLDQASDSSSYDPRFGFTYDLKGDGKTLIRGGYGWFSSPNPSLTVSNTMMNNGLTTSTYAIRLGTSTQPLFTNGGVLSYAQRVTNGGTTLTPLDPALLATTAGSISGRTGQVWDPRNDMSVAKRSALGIEHAYDNGLKLGIQGVYAKFENLQYFVNINLSQRSGPALTDPVVAGAIYNDGYALPYNSFSTTRPGRAVVAGRSLDFIGSNSASPFFGDVFLNKNDGEGTYKAIILTASMRRDSGWGFSTSATWSKAEDNNSNERTTASNTADSNTNNPADPLATNSYSSNDRPFRFSFAGYFPVYWGITGAVNMSYTSGAPYSAMDGRDLNGDGGRNDYAAGTVRNGSRQPITKTFDLRLARAFKPTQRFQVETFVDVFNLFNWANQRTTLTQLISSTGVVNPDFGFINLPDRNTREVQLGVRAKF